MSKKWQAEFTPTGPPKRSRGIDDDGDDNDDGGSDAKALLEMSKFEKNLSINTSNGAFQIANGATQTRIASGSAELVKTAVANGDWAMVEMHTRVVKAEIERARKEFAKGLKAMETLHRIATRRLMSQALDNGQSYYFWIVRTDSVSSAMDDIGVLAFFVDKEPRDAYLRTLQSQNRDRLVQFSAKEGVYDIENPTYVVHADADGDEPVAFFKSEAEAQKYAATIGHPVHIEALED